MADVLNSFTRYFNIKNERKGPLFLPQFKSKVIRSEEQMIHVSRYIHLNPYSNGLITNINQLEKYYFSSFKEYLRDKKRLETNLCNTDLILSIFHKKERYKQFVLGNAKYQKTLEYIKHVQKWL